MQDSPINLKRNTNSTLHKKYKNFTPNELKLFHQYSGWCKKGLKWNWKLMWNQNGHFTRWTYGSYRKGNKIKWNEIIFLPFFLFSKKITINKNENIFLINSSLSKGWSFRRVLFSPSKWHIDGIIWVCVVSTCPTFTFIHQITIFHHIIDDKRVEKNKNIYMRFIWLPSILRTDDTSRAINGIHHKVVSSRVRVCYVNGKMAKRGENSPLLCKRKIFFLSVMEVDIKTS